MKVALVHDWLNGMRGGEKVLEAFCELFPDAVIHTLFYEPEKVSKRISSLEVRTSYLNKIPGVHKFYRTLLPFFPKAVEHFDLSGFDLVISSSHSVAKGCRPPPHSLHICYCYSPMRYIWDRFDDYFRREDIGMVKYSLAKSLASRLRRWDIESSERVDLFVADSAFVQSRISRFYGRPSVVIHPFADTDFFRPESRPDSLDATSFGQQYYLAVSALVPYKRIGDIVDAFRGMEAQVVIVGDGPERKKLSETAPPNVRFSGWVSDERLREIYQRCKALIFPGVEDFGIVPVEAQACGKPVIALAEGGALETIIGPVIESAADFGTRATGLFYKVPGKDGILKAVRQLDNMKFDPEYIRSNALKFSRSRFLESARVFITESYNRFKANGRAGLEEEMTGARNVGGKP